VIVLVCWTAVTWTCWPTSAGRRGRAAHPSAEHFAPIFVTLGAAAGAPAPVTTITGYWLGLAKRSIQLA
jgi:hypothetical protein